MEPVSLYWEYRAELPEPPEGFPRLYFHGAAGTTSNLGVFRPEDGMAVLTGRISRRTLGHDPGEGRFSLSETPWRPLDVPGFSVPVLGVKTEPGYRLLFWERGDIPEEAVSRFCFFRRTVIRDEAYLLLSVDERGDPVLPEISP